MRRPNRKPPSREGSAATWGAAWAFAALALCAVSAARAQDDDEIRRHGIFVESIEVSLVSVELYATRDGEPVPDLGADELELRIDGEPVAIASLERFGGGADAAPLEAPGDGRSDQDGAAIGAIEGEPAAPPDQVAEGARASGVATAPEPAAVIVLVDQLFLSPLSRAQVFDELRDQLEPLLAQGARILVAGKTRDRVRIEQGFTDDPQQVRAALARLGDQAPPGYDTEIRNILELWSLAPRATDSRRSGPGQPESALQTSELDARSAFQEARSVTQRMHTDLSDSLRALHRFLDALAGLPGRKAMVYVADQLPVRPAELLWRVWWQEFGVEHGARLGASPSGPADLDATAQLEELIADATAARVAFYPVGTERGPDLTSASSRGTPTRSGVPMARSSASPSADGLRWLAQRTGGRGATGPGAAHGFFAALARDLSGYYSLAFASPHRGDGKPHRIEVRCRRPGVELRHPTQYRDKSADQRLADRLLSTLTLGLEDDPLEVRVTLGKVRTVRGGRRETITVPLSLHVPMANLVLLPDAKVHRGKLSVQLVARDARGRVSDPVVVRLPLEVAHRDLSWALTQTIDYETEMTLDAGGGTIAIGVQDDYGLVASTVHVDVGEGESR